MKSLINAYTTADFKMCGGVTVSQRYRRTGFKFRPSTLRSLFHKHPWNRYESICNYRLNSRLTNLEEVKF